MRRHFAGLLGVAGRCCSSWDHGNEGYEWKKRHLDERRELAMEYLFDVGRRAPIHDAVRTRARLNEQRLRMPHEDEEVPEDATASEVLGHSLGADELDDDLDTDDLPTQSFSGLDEASGDTLRYLSTDDVRQLAEELYGSVGASADARRDALLREWFALRRESGAAAGFTSVPKQERTPWTAWYLRDMGR